MALPRKSPAGIVRKRARRRRTLFGRGLFLFPTTNKGQPPNDNEKNNRLVPTFCTLHFAISNLQFSSPLHLFTPSPAHPLIPLPTPYSLPPPQPCPSKNS